ncbi:MAG: hypothetical protein WAU86_01340 [Oricola sp.]
MNPGNRFTRAIVLLALSLLSMSGSPAVGSSDGAWSAFRTTVQDACTAAAADRMKVGAMRIDPFGTETYGVAVLTDSGTGEEHVCVYDKARGAAEVGGPLQAVTDPSQPFAAQDLAQLADLRARVLATLADMTAKGLAANGQADTVQAMLDGKVKSDDLGSTAPGPYRCTVYWYGFLDEGASRVGAHRCTVAAGDKGGLVIDKTTGDRFHAVTVPWENGLTAFAGRTFLPNHDETRYDPDNPANRANDNYGNKVGLVLRSGERLFLVSIDERGMSPPDPTFFEITELVPQL